MQGTGLLGEPQMSKPPKLLVVSLIALGLAAGVWTLLRSLDGPAARAEVSGVASSAPTPPAWLVAEARREARILDDVHPDAAYWGLVSVGDMGRLTGDKPGTPRLKMYVVILTGSFSTATLSHPYGAPDLGRGTTAWYEFGPETHECGGSGMSWGTPRTPTVPGLQPLAL